MSTEYCLTSNELTIKAENEGALIEAIDQTMGDYADSVDTEFEPEDDGELKFTFYFGGEAGDSFPERVGKLAAAIGPYLMGSARLKLREETMGDDRDQVFYAGASPEIIKQAMANDLLWEAKEALSNIVTKTGDYSCPVLIASSLALDSLNKAIEANKPGPVVAADVLVINTDWGQLRMPAGAELISSMDGHTLLAAVRRDDGDADVLGSINLKAVAQHANQPDALTQAMAQFVSMHPSANIFKIAEHVVDVLEISAEKQTTENIDTPA